MSSSNKTYTGIPMDRKKFDPELILAARNDSIFPAGYDANDPYHIKLYHKARNASDAEIESMQRDWRSKVNNMKKLFNRPKAKWVKDQDFFLRKLEGNSPLEPEHLAYEKEMLRVRKVELDSMEDMINGVEDQVKWYKRVQQGEV